MTARFRVLSVFPFPAHGIVLVDGLLEGRHLLPGSVWYLESRTERTVTIKDVALVGGRQPGDRTMTVAILPPSFPEQDLVGATLIERPST